MGPMDNRLLFHREIYTEVVERLIHARRTVWIATADLKDMHVEMARGFVPILEVFDEMAGRGVRFRIIHAKLPSAPFRETLDRFRRLVEGALELQVCPRSHWKMVIVDGEVGYLGSANFTGAGMGVKKAERRNHEVGILTQDPAMIGELAGEFDRFWMGNYCQRCAFRDDCPDPID